MNDRISLSKRSSRIIKKALSSFYKELKIGRLTIVFAKKRGYVPFPGVKCGTSWDYDYGVYHTTWYNLEFHVWRFWLEFHWKSNFQIKREQDEERDAVRL